MKTVLFVWKRCSGRKMSNQISQAVGMLFPYARLDVTAEEMLSSSVGLSTYIWLAEAR